MATCSKYHSFRDERRGGGGRPCRLSETTRQKGPPLPPLLSACQQAGTMTGSSMWSLDASTLFVCHIAYTCRRREPITPYDKQEDPAAAGGYSHLRALAGVACLPVLSVRDRPSITVSAVSRTSRWLGGWRIPWLNRTRDREALGEQARKKQEIPHCLSTACVLMLWWMVSKLIYHMQTPFRDKKGPHGQEPLAANEATRNASATNFPSVSLSNH